MGWFDSGHIPLIASHQTAIKNTLAMNRWVNISGWFWTSVFWIFSVSDCLIYVSGDNGLTVQNKVLLQSLHCT